MSGKHHLERAMQERECAYSARCQQALEAHLQLAELHDHERALAMYQENMQAIRTAEMRQKLSEDIQGLTLALYGVN